MTDGMRPKGNGLRDFQVYDLKGSVGAPVRGLRLSLQSDIERRPETVTLQQLTRFADSLEKDYPPGPMHLNWYTAADKRDPCPRIAVRISNKIVGLDVWVAVQRVVGVLAPATKRVLPNGDPSGPSLLSHFKVYELVEGKEAPRKPAVKLEDEFWRRMAKVRDQVGLAVPVTLGGPSPPYDFSVHDVGISAGLTVYRVTSPRRPTVDIDTGDQFSSYEATLGPCRLSGVGTTIHECRPQH